MEETSLNAQVAAGGTDASEQAEPTVATEQKETQVAKSFQDILLEQAIADGVPVSGYEPPREIGEKDDEPEVEAIADITTESEDAEPAQDDAGEAEEPEVVEAKAKDVWPDSAKKRVSEETEKRKRANERAERAEQLAAQLQEQVAKVTAPQPTTDDPFRDIQDYSKLETLKHSYNKAISVLDEAIDVADESESGTAEVVVDVRDGKPVTAELTKAQLKEKKRQADEALRLHIPEREKYLTLRAQETARAVEAYAELKNPESEFTQAVGGLLHSILTGQAMKEPDVAIWAADAVYGRQQRLAKNGKHVGSKEAEKIIEASKQKIAPTPTRTRSLPERASRSSDLAKVEAKFNATKSRDDADAYTAALLAKTGSSRTRKLVPTSGY